LTKPGELKVEDGAKRSPPHPLLRYYLIMFRVSCINWSAAVMVLEFAV
jgi:hypothetical protein